MNGNEKARTEAATSERARENAMPASNGNPAPDSITRAGAGQDFILDFLPVGAENAVTAGTLAAWTGMKRRDVTKAIRRARLQGMPICSSCGYPMGYFLATDTGELRTCVRELEGRAAEITEVAQKLGDILRGLGVRE